MKLRRAFKSHFAILLLVPVMFEADSQPTNGELSVENQAVNSALEAQKRIRDHMLAGEAQQVAELISSDFIATDPSNTVRSRDDLVALVASGRLTYDSIAIEVDTAKQLSDDLVAILGFESSTQTAVPVEGELSEIARTNTLRRRFTDVFRNEGGKWRLLLKQSTIVALE